MLSLDDFKEITMISCILTKIMTKHVASSRCICTIISLTNDRFTTVFIEVLVFIIWVYFQELSWEFATLPFFVNLSKVSINSVLWIWFICKNILLLLSIFFLLFAAFFFIFFLLFLFSLFLFFLLLIFFKTIDHVDQLFLNSFGLIYDISLHVVNFISNLMHLFGERFKKVNIFTFFNVFDKLLQEIFYFFLIWSNFGLNILSSLFQIFSLVILIFFHLILSNFLLNDDIGFIHLHIGFVALFQEIFNIFRNWLQSINKMFESIWSFLIWWR